MNSPRHHGYALLALLLIMFVSGTSFMIGALGNRQSAALAQQQELSRQLVLAKESLLAYAAHTPVLYGNNLGPGFLPCPDTDNNGWPEATTGDDFEDEANTLCPAGVTLGRLPEKITTPGGLYRFNDYYAGVDLQFWYAVARQHVRTTSNPAANRTNSSLSRLSLDDTDGIVALIIAPGAELDTQARTDNNLLPSNYLDWDNAQDAFATTDFITVYEANPELFNDTVLPITHDELMQVAGFAAVSRIKVKLDDFNDSNGQYPSNSWWNQQCVQSSYLTAMDDPWMASEGWNSSSDCSLWIWTSRLPTMSFYSRNATDSDKATLYFSGCTNMKFEITHDGGIDRVGDQC